MFDTKTTEVPPLSKVKSDFWKGVMFSKDCVREGLDPLKESESIEIAQPKDMYKTTFTKGVYRFLKDIGRVKHHSKKFSSEYKAIEFYTWFEKVLIALQESNTAYNRGRTKSVWWHYPDIHSLKKKFSNGEPLPEPEVYAEYYNAFYEAEMIKDYISDVDNVIYSYTNFDRDEVPWKVKLTIALEALSDRSAVKGSSNSNRRAALGVIATKGLNQFI